MRLHRMRYEQEIKNATLCASRSCSIDEMCVNMIDHSIEIVMIDNREIVEFVVVCVVHQFINCHVKHRCDLCDMQMMHRLHA